MVKMAQFVACYLDTVRFRGKCLRACDGHNQQHPGSQVTATGKGSHEAEADDTLGKGRCEFGRKHLGHISLCSEVPHHLREPTANHSCCHHPQAGQQSLKILQGCSSQQLSPSCCCVDNLCPQEQVLWVLGLLAVLGVASRGSMTRDIFWRNKMIENLGSH